MCSLFHEEEDEAAAAATPSLSWEGSLPSLGLGRDIFLRRVAVNCYSFSKGFLKKGKKCICVVLLRAWNWWDHVFKSWDGWKPFHPKTIDDETWQWGQKVWFTNEHVDVHRTNPFLTPLCHGSYTMKNNLLLLVWSIISIYICLWHHSTVTFLIFFWYQPPLNIVLSWIKLCLFLRC